MVVGWDRRATYDTLRVASVLVGRGARLVATNRDASYPAPGGELWPGAGALLAAVETATGVRADSAGKPGPGLFRAAARRAGDGPAVVVGDRLDTDIVGAERAGLDAVLVLSGASTRADLLDVDAAPVAVVPDLGGVLDRPIVEVRPGADSDRTAAERLRADAGLAAEEDHHEAAVWMVGERDEAVVATATLQTRDGDGYLRGVAVHEAGRGTGAATLVVAAAIRAGAAAGVRMVFLLTEGADGFFDRLGFRPVGRDELPGWLRAASAACPDSAVAMRRAVAGYAVVR